jgi:hypothetical protein
MLIPRVDYSNQLPQNDPIIYDINEYSAKELKKNDNEMTWMISSVLGGTTGIVLAARYDLGLIEGAGLFVLGTGIVVAASKSLDYYLLNSKKRLEDKAD